ncbi:hypothetical protein Forpi1262_v014246 [Fusarium oxysporum f. sp. raphani]|uniref:Uncharacterized protein n=1 Tax=Fusarium oxysporum f. sp. raphani TaxID=96318 RepID=A0A8J5P1U4_FUSOX|nr:hypothetical protein Forpi1262_v018963 [Fusarium oxysporum f. sp. raphani]KAG7410401.1 hypothetical protein Forpi1262_v017523 [Fusarium oxysporum f. sp. raphani]KAG7410415.1 hypothetical protein Forpi1262_v017650 [Fusarium oxysporum f. sp. raphani]KAG7424584.1 hypothetical protein Forpi1262_v014246 [Fusarium oxysporum f. sp. raphani]
MAFPNRSIDLTGSAKSIGHVSLLVLEYYEQRSFFNRKRNCGIQGYEHWLQLPTAAVHTCRRDWHLFNRRRRNPQTAH